MNYILVLGVIGILGAASPSVAAASKTPDQKEIASNRKIMSGFASCIVNSYTKQATEVIALNIDNATINKRYERLLDGACLAKTADVVALGMGGDLFRYALADAIFQKDFAKAATPDFAQVPKLEHVPFADKATFEAEIAKVKNKRKRASRQERFDEDNIVAYLSRFGECVVRLNPIAARNLLLTPVDSPNELAAIGPLRSMMADCLKPGSTVTFNAGMIRGVTAINYVRLAMSMPAIVSESAR